MVEIGGRPILWHVIKQFFANYYLHASDVTFDIAANRMEVHQESAEPWRVTLIDTGEETATGGRLKRVLDYVGEQDFVFTYGDGVTDLDIGALREFHCQHGAL